VGQYIAVCCFLAGLRILGRREQPAGQSLTFRWPEESPQTQSNLFVDGEDVQEVANLSVRAGFWESGMMSLAKLACAAVVYLFAPMASSSTRCGVSDLDMRSHAKHRSPVVFGLALQ